MKKAGISMLLFISLVVIVSCSSKSDNEPAMNLPEVQIIANGTELQVQSRALSEYDDSNTDLFKSMVATADASTIPYIELGSAVEIILHNITPDSYRLTEYILNNDGSLKYAPSPEEAPQDSMMISFQEGSGAFILKPHPMALLSSQSTDYNPGATIRGFRFVTNTAGQMKEYAFVLRSDATAQDHRTE
ncbi:hypothetical protein PCURB6_40290 [Paenibacillus curdlanolyticus]|nr:hypothetical protein [Paenibacillus curdlanolyticus]GFN33769.1 hypothetical protein PCURB6_40290 [Paenibacillus curdlanolyticus]